MVLHGVVQKQNAEYGKLRVDILMNLSTGDWIAILLVMVTAIGGIIVPIVLHHLSKTRDSGQNVINQGSLMTYINTSARIEELYKRIASVGNTDNGEGVLSALLYPFIIDELYYLGLQTISDLDNSIKEDEDSIVRFAEALYKEKSVKISKGECIKILCDFLMAKNRSIEQTVRYYDKNSIHLPKEREPYAKK